MNYVYLLRCADGTLYCGWTNDLPARVAAHNSGSGAKYTRSRLPVELVYFEEYEDRQEAMSREWHIKHMSRVQKLRLVEEKQRDVIGKPAADRKGVSETNDTIRLVTEEDYDALFKLWNSSPECRRALNPIDDSREGIAKYLKRNPKTCFAAVSEGRIIGVILSGHDGRRGIIHHLCVHPDFRRMGIAKHLVSSAEEALQKEGIQKVFGLVFKDNDTANAFWEAQGYPARTNLNYRNKSLNENIPTGE